MLTLSRRLGQTVRIGDNIVLTIQKIDRLGVHIGIEAPKSVPVDRAEVHARRKAGLPAPGRTVTEDDGESD